MPVKFVVSLIALALSAGVAGCTARVYPASGHVIVRAPPPPPRYEIVPVAPTHEYVWVGGYWSWGGTRYLWRPGHYVRAPQYGAVYRRPHWVRSGVYYRFVPGRWVVRNEPRIYRRAPPPPSRRY
jgi:YXWGXW repeat-containing protein